MLQYFIKNLRSKYTKKINLWVLSPTFFGVITSIFLLQKEAMLSPEKKQKALIQFGIQLKKLRKAKKLSLRKVAASCNVDHSDIQKFEKGKVNITILTLMDLSNGLSVHPKELMNFDVEFFKEA